MGYHKENSGGQAGCGDGVGDERLPGPRSGSGLGGDPGLPEPPSLASPSGVNECPKEIAVAECLFSLGKLRSVSLPSRSPGAGSAGAPARLALTATGLWIERRAGGVCRQPEWVCVAGARFPGNYGPAISGPQFRFAHVSFRSCTLGSSRGLGDPH